MDTNRIIQRARAILLTPRTEWPVIAAEPATVQDLYRDYILALAAIAPICRFIKTCLIGYGWHGFRVYRLGISAGLAEAIVGYVMALVAVYALALVIDALASNFGGQPNRLQALKVTAYSFTAAWIAGVAQLLPDFDGPGTLGLHGLIGLAGTGYSVYLLYLGLPATMRAPAERVAAYTAIAVVVALVMAWLIGLITGAAAGVSLSAAYG
jgi:Yip1 domain